MGCFENIRQRCDRLSDVEVVMMIPTSWMMVVGQQVRRYTMNLDTQMKFRYPSLGVYVPVLDM
jgi:hypothetical protein